MPLIDDWRMMSNAGPSAPVLQTAWPSVRGQATAYPYEYPCGEWLRVCRAAALVEMHDGKTHVDVAVVELWPRRTSDATCRERLDEPPARRGHGAALYCACPPPGHSAPSSLP